MTPDAVDRPGGCSSSTATACRTAYFALPTSLATTTGQVTNAVYGFTSMLIKLLAEERPDLDRGGVRRGQADRPPGEVRRVQGGRAEAPDEFRQQLGLIVEVLETLRSR